VNYNKDVCVSELFDFLQPHLVHVPFWLGWAMPERYRQQSPRIQHRDELAKSVWPVVEGQMLPDRA
jgi:hypothetical protein